MAEYKINMQNSVAFLYPNYKHTKKEIGTAILFEIAKQNEKLQINPYPPNQGSKISLQ